MTYQKAKLYLTRARKSALEDRPERAHELIQRAREHSASTNEIVTQLGPDAWKIMRNWARVQNT